MQTTKSRSPLNVPQKISPATPRNGWKLKTPRSDSDPLSSPSPVRKSPKNRSPNVVDRRSPRSPAAEKKRPGKVSELESQLAQLQDELKKAKDQLSSSESLKKKSQQEAEEAKNQFVAVLAELDQTQKQLKEISDSENARIQELRKISQDRDKAWQSELEAVQKQHTMDSAALASALNEIQRLRIQSNKISEYEASQAKDVESAHVEIHTLRVELKKTIDLVENLKSQLNDSRESEMRALEEFASAQVVFEVVKNIELTLKLENGNVMESYKSLLAELEGSKNKVDYLEGLVSKFQSDLANSSKISVEAENGVCDQTKMLEMEFNDLKHEATRLQDALEDAERRYQEQHLEMTAQLKDTNELVKQTKKESCEKEAELEAALKESKADFEELKTKLTEKENELQNELKKSESVVEEMHLQSLIKENETLNSEIMKIETEKSKENHEAIALVEAARAAERESLLKLGNLTVEADESSRKAAQLTEQLDAAEAANSEIEAELRRLKVQSDQWRKAAEAAAAMLSSGNNNNNNGKYVEKMGNSDFQTIGGKLGSPFSDEESPVKKNGNMLKKIGVLLKKGQK